MAKKKKKAAKRRVPNPPKMRKLAKSTAWMKATAVKIVKRRGKPDQVLIRRAGSKKRSTKKRR